MGWTRLPAARLPAALLLAVALAGCSSNNSGSPGDSGTGAAGAAAPSPMPPSATETAPATGSPRPGAVVDQQAVAAQDNPPGDIADNLAFVRYSNKLGGYSFTHPEGWAETVRGTAVTFTDKLNGVHLEIGAATIPPTVSSARADSVPVLEGTQPAFELRGVSAASTQAGRGVKIVYRRNSEPDSVTGRQYRDEVERYELVRNGHQIIVELYGPVGADNVDAYTTMIDSLAFR